MTLTDIQSLTIQEVREMITLAIRNGLDGNVVDDFVASVDWSRHGTASPEIKEILGNIEGWATAYREGDMSLAEYAGKLLAILAGKYPVTA